MVLDLVNLLSTWRVVLALAVSGGMALLLFGFGRKASDCRTGAAAAT